MLTFGIDIGTSSTKAVVVDERGRVIRQAVRQHVVDRPQVGWFEMDAAIWWAELVSLAEELTAGLPEPVAAVGVSGMGPNTVLTDEHGDPIRPAILYGVDTRSVRQVEELTRRYGEEAILESGGSALSSQAVGPKLLWVRQQEPSVWARARRLFMPASWLAFRLTGEYALDHHSASQCTPLYDVEGLRWREDWSADVAPGIELPPLRWAGDQAGVTATLLGGIPVGTPVIVGTIDAWTEGVSVGATRIGDLMLMYGTTMFMVATVERPLRTPSMWGTVGTADGERNLAGGLATSGAITDWVRALSGSPDFATLIGEAEASGVGARGLLMLPYFAGERTPIMDPLARGVIAGLTTSHGRGDLYRAALEATAFAVRHNVDTMVEAGADLRRVVAVGGGTKSDLWLQIVSDVTGLPQVVPEQTVGASYGAAYLAARLIESVDIDVWNPPARIVEPDPRTASAYAERYALFRSLYPATRAIAHALAG